MSIKKAYLPLIIGIAVAVGIGLGTLLNFNNGSVFFSSNSNEAKIKKLYSFFFCNEVLQIYSKESLPNEAWLYEYSNIYEDVLERYAGKSKNIQK